MKKYIMLLLAVLMTALTSTAFAFTPPDKPADGWYVIDQAGKLTEDQKSQLNTKIDNINKTTKNEFGVLIINSLDGDDIEDAAQVTFRSWGIGKAGLNNGILLMISAGDRKMRLQTGKGVEGDLPDLRAKDLLDEQLKPSLKAGDWYGGIDKLITATSGYLESRAGQQAAEKSTSPVDANPVADSTPSSDVSSAVGLVVLFGLGFGILMLCIFLVIRHYSKRKEAMLQAERDAEYDAERLRIVKRKNEAQRQRDEEERQRLLARTPAIPAVTHTATSKVYHTSSATAIGAGAAAAVVGGGIAVAIGATALAAERERAAKRRREEEEESANRRRREDEARRRRDEEDADRRRREESSSYSSYSSSDSGSSFGGGGFDGGGGFGGGDSGGGGASSDF